MLKRRKKLNASLWNIVISSSNICFVALLKIKANKVRLFLLKKKSNLNYSILILIIQISLIIVGDIKLKGLIKRYVFYLINLKYIK